MKLKLRIIYALHMLVPAAIAAWHLSRLEPATVLELRRLFA